MLLPGPVAEGFSVCTDPPGPSRLDNFIPPEMGVPDGAGVPADEAEGGGPSTLIPGAAPVAGVPDVDVAGEPAPGFAALAEPRRSPKGLGKVLDVNGLNPPGVSEPRGLEEPPGVVADAEVEAGAKPADEVGLFRLDEAGVELEPPSPVLVPRLLLSGLTAPDTALGLGNSAVGVLNLPAESSLAPSLPTGPAPADFFSN